MVIISPQFLDMRSKKYTLKNFKGGMPRIPLARGSRLCHDHVYTNTFCKLPPLPLPSNTSYFILFVPFMWRSQIYISPDILLLLLYFVIKYLLFSFRFSFIVHTYVYILHTMAWYICVTVIWSVMIWLSRFYYIYELYFRLNRFNFIILHWITQFVMLLDHIKKHIVIL